MRSSKKVHLQHIFLLLILSFILLTYSDSEYDLTKTTICGKIPIQEPLNHMSLCRSQKLYLRTSQGLFPISSVNYTARFLTISHSSSCSHSNHYDLSPKTLNPSSLFLFNCSRASEHDQQLLPFMRNHTCSDSCEGKEEKYKTFSNDCLLIDDIEKLHQLGFHPKDFNCSHYRRIYRQAFEIPDHVPNICEECEKPNANCGAGLRCICHPKECKDKVISNKGVGSFKAVGNIMVSLVCFLSLIMV